jgi:hypothetical protein
MIKNTRKRRNNIEKTPAGTFRARKTINGNSFDRSFRTKTEAKNQLGIWVAQYS